MPFIYLNQDAEGVMSLTDIVAGLSATPHTMKNPEQTARLCFLAWVLELDTPQNIAAEAQRALNQLPNDTESTQALICFRDLLSNTIKTSTCVPLRRRAGRRLSRADRVLH